MFYQDDLPNFAHHFFHCSDNSIPGLVYYQKDILVKKILSMHLTCKFQLIPLSHVFTIHVFVRLGTDALGGAE
jgi:hypothetical protein